MTVKEQRRAITGVVFIFAVLSAAAVLVDLTWMSMITGLLGSALLILPPLRIEREKWLKDNLEKLNPHSPDLVKLRDRLADRVNKRLGEWKFWDSYFLGLGGILLLASFLFQMAAVVLAPPPHSPPYGDVAEMSQASASAAPVVRIAELRDDFERRDREWLPDVMRLAESKPT